VVRSRRQLPELEYSLRSAQIGGLPIYFSTGAGLHSIEVETTGPDETETIAFERAYVTPQISVPLGTTWLSATLSASGKAVWYTDSLSVPDESGDRVYTGESISQSSGAFAANIVGPSFSRVFHEGLGQWAKFKHVVEPRWDYNVTGEVDDEELIPRFDQIDNSSLATERVTFRLINRLLAKPEDDTLFGAREIMSLELLQSVSLKDDQPLTRFTLPADDPENPTDEPLQLTLQESPIDLRYRYRPSLSTNVDVSTQFNTLFNQFNRASLTAGKQVGSSRYFLTYSNVFDPRTGDTVGSQVRLATAFTFLRERLRWQAGVNYDVVAGLLQQHSHAIQFITQCWGLHLDLREYKSLVREDRDIRFSISLRNVGNFIDINDSTRDNGNSSF
jgi:hypothetical protein